MHHLLKASIAAAVLALPGTAQALPQITGLIDATGAYTKVNTGASHLDQFGGHGSVLASMPPGWNVQLNAGYERLAGTGGSDLFVVSTDLFWRDRKGAIGVSAGYADVGAPAAPYFSAAKNLETYGVFGEYFPYQSLTLQWKVGGATGVVGGGYGGVGIVWYDSPDLAMHIESNLTAFRSGHDWWNINASLEYLPFHNTPVSIFLGYDFTRISGASNHVQTMFWGLKYHIGRGDSLVVYDRTGPLQWNGKMTPGGQLKF